MRDLCDTLMQNHAPAVNAKIEDEIVQFRASLRPEQRKQFNDILDLVNSSDSEYAYEAFKCGIARICMLIVNSYVSIYISIFFTYAIVK